MKPAFLRPPPRRGPAPLPEPGAVLVRLPNWLGDLLVATAFLRALLRRFPGVPVDLVARREFEALPLPHRGRVHVFDRQAVSAGAFGRGLRGLGYTHCFVLPPSFSAAWMAFRARVPWRIGHPGDGRRWLLRPALPHRQAPRSVHLVRDYLELLAPWCDGAPPEERPGLEADAAWLEAHRPPALNDGPPYVALAPGAEYGPAKQWPPAHYAELARALAARGWRPVVVGLARERDLGAAILRGLPDGLNLCGATDLPGLAAALGGAACVVSNDSGAMHLAAALGRPQVALFGSTNPYWTAPLNPRARVLYRAEPCSPCYARTCPLGHTRCLVELAPAEALAAAEGLLAGGAPA